MKVYCRWMMLLALGCEGKTVSAPEPDVDKSVETPEDSGEAPLPSSFEVTSTICDD